jgi:hypothetical protein
VLTVGGVPVTVNAGGELVIGSMTVAPGSSAVAVVSGTTFSIAPAPGTSALAVVVNGVTAETLALMPDPTAAAVVTLGGTMYTANSNGDVVIAGQTLAPGHSITVSGTVVSLPPAGTSTLDPSTAGYTGQVFQGRGSRAARMPSLIMAMVMIIAGL